MVGGFLGGVRIEREELAMVLIWERGFRRGCWCECRVIGDQSSAGRWAVQRIGGGGREGGALRRRPGAGREASSLAEGVDRERAEEIWGGAGCEGAAAIGARAARGEPADGSRKKKKRVGGQCIKPSTRSSRIVVVLKVNRYVRRLNTNPSFMLWSLFRSIRSSGHVRSRNHNQNTGHEMSHGRAHGNPEVIMKQLQSNVRSPGHEKRPCDCIGPLNCLFRRHRQCRILGVGAIKSPGNKSHCKGMGLLLETPSTERLPMSFDQSKRHLNSLMDQKGKGFQFDTYGIDRWACPGKQLPIGSNL
ncbi:uncharacterized protein A4U43_C04F31920 [Asparagus officinalis]|uniref:Uncharacterized protein n=1 Tax=Asparagus officinalis TaxID=4686 RepID=A0A5P1F6V1_ASPOF|nr:uncharacterized protein A4U43_C04F31920 [Asparagus officinalis]